MKKGILIGAVAVFTLGFTSCSSEECCDCASVENPNIEIEDGNEICEGDVEEAGGNWQQTKEIHNGFGCDCD